MEMNFVFRSGSVDPVRRRDQRHSPFAGQFLSQLVAERCPLADGRNARLSSLRLLLPTADVRCRIAKEHLWTRMGYRETRSLLGHSDQLRMDLCPLGSQSDRGPHPQVHGLRPKEKTKECPSRTETKEQNKKWATGSVVFVLLFYLPGDDEDALLYEYLFLKSNSYYFYLDRKLYGLLFSLAPGLFFISSQACLFV